MEDDNEELVEEEFEGASQSDWLEKGDPQELKRQQDMEGVVLAQLQTLRKRGI